MKYRKFIDGAAEVSEIGLGAWQLGENSGWRGIPEKEATAMVKEALGLGVNFFDTAPGYGLGSSELRLGKALKGIDRQKIIVNTKFGHNADGKTDWSVKNIRRSLEGSLTRLGMDYVDSLIIHNPPLEYLNGKLHAHYDELEKLKEEGKIRAYGASVDRSEEMELMMTSTNAGVFEVFYNVLHQEPARSFERAQKKGMGIIVKIPLDSGWLTGKYHADSRFTDIRSRWSTEDIRTRAGLVDDYLSIIGPGRDPAPTAVAFCLAHPAVSTVIPGNVDIRQLRHNTDSSGIDLPSEILSELYDLYDRKISRSPLPW